MWALVVLIVVVVVALLLARAVHQAQQTRPRGDSPSSARHPAGSPQADHQQGPGPEPSAQPDYEILAQHVSKLREAVAQGWITSDEAVGSIVRFTNHTWSAQAAAELLHNTDAA